MVLCQTKKVILFKIDVDTSAAAVEDDDDGSGALIIESNGLVHIINCIAFTFLASVSKVNSKSTRKKNYDVIRFIPSNLFVYGPWHLIFHRYRRERVRPPKKFHACVEIKVYNVPSIDKIYYIVHNHH